MLCSLTPVILFWRLMHYNVGGNFELSARHVQVNRCLSIKGAEDQINKPYAFEISTTESSMYFVADKDKVLHHYQ